MCAITNHYFIFTFVPIKFHYFKKKCGLETRFYKQIMYVLFKKYITNFGSNFFSADKNVLFGNYGETKVER